MSHHQRKTNKLRLLLKRNLRSKVKRERKKENLRSLKRKKRKLFKKKRKNLRSQKRKERKLLKRKKKLPLKKSLRSKMRKLNPIVMILKARVKLMVKNQIELLIHLKTLATAFRFKAIWNLSCQHIIITDLTQGLLDLPDQRYYLPASSHQVPLLSQS